MTFLVVSHAWTIDEHAHADAYVALSAQMTEFMKQQPGFLGRWLVRGEDDRTHFTNLRRFSRKADYEELFMRPGYRELIEAMGRHLRPHDGAGREYMEIVLDEYPLSPPG